MGLAIALAPLERAFGIEAVHVTTMQAISGAGYAGVASYAILDNVIPYIGGGEEEKIETEPRKILGGWNDDRFADAPMKISAQVNRVPTIDGHLMTISAKLRKQASLDDVRAAHRVLHRRAAAPRTSVRAASVRSTSSTRPIARSRASTATASTAWPSPSAASAPAPSSTSASSRSCTTPSAAPPARRF